MKDTF